MRALWYLVLGLVALTSASGQTDNPNGGWPNGGFHRNGLEAGVIVGVVAAGIGVAFAGYYLASHNRGLEGCVVEADGKKTLVDSNKKVYSLLDGGPSLPVGERVKVKSHKSGPKAASSIQVEKIIEVYGPCTP